MTVYTLDTTQTDIPIYNSEANSASDDHEAWLLAYLSKLERRTELGRCLDDDAHAWLFREAFPERHVFWFECLAEADLEGIVYFRQLHSWSRFETGRKQRYLIAGLVEHGLVERLDDQRLQVLQ
ncbi:MAG: hypothetical protein AAF708_00435 [Deinococcota bacterium]